MNRLRTALVLIVIAALLACGCGRAARDNGVPDDSIISANAVISDNSDENDSIPGDSTVAAAAENSVLSTSGKRNEHLIYLIIPTETGLSAQMEDIILDGARSAGYDVIVKTHEFTAEKQSKAFAEAVSEKACAIICDNIAGDGIKSDARTARNAGIPVFLVNRGVPDESVCDGQVRTDRNSTMAYLAEIFVRHHRLSETYALIYNANNSFENLYVASFRRGLNGFENMKEATEVGLADLDSGNVQNVIRSVLGINSSVGTFVCGNSEEAIAVIEALKALEIEKEVICLDGNNDRLPAFVSEGAVYATVVKPAEELAEKILEIVLSYLQSGEAHTGTAYVPGVVISSDEPASLDDIIWEIEQEEDQSSSESYDYGEDDNDYNYDYDGEYDYDDSGSGADSGTNDSDSSGAVDSGSDDVDSSSPDSSSEGESGGESDAGETVSGSDGGAGERSGDFST